MINFNSAEAKRQSPLPSADPSATVDRPQREAGAGGVNKGVDLHELLAICAHYWYWFAISVFVCVGLAWINYKRTAPIYQRSAMIQIVRPDGSTQGNQGSALFEALGMGAAYPEKMSEKIIITSPSVMTAVAKRLNLQTSYTVPGGWHPTTLYGSTLPFTVSFPGVDDETVCSMVAEVRPGGIVHIESLTGTTPDGETIDIPALNATVDYAAGKTLKTPLGNIVFMANPMYRGEITEAFPLHISKSSTYKTALGLSGSVITSIPEEFAEIISLSKTDVSGERASDILNAVIAVYNEQWAAEREKVAATTSNFINERLNHIASELENVESDIAGYKSSHLGGVDAATVSASYIGQANRANEQVIELNNCLVMAGYVRDFMSNAANQNEVLPSNAGVGSVNIESQITRYNELLMARNRLVANSSPSNPIVLDYDSQLAALRAALLKSLDNAITLYNQQIQAARQNESVASAKVAATPTQAQHLLSVERKQKVIESLYLFLMQKREETELSQKYISQRVRIISAANGSPAPIAPQRNNALLIALIIGLFAPLAVIYVVEALNNKVRSRRDLGALKIPYLGEIPDVAPRATRLRRLLPGGKRLLPNTIMVHKDSSNIINEAFRMLRTNLELMKRRSANSDAPRTAVTLSVTSLNPGSGKTFVSMNLAAALAVKGYRVLIVDMDLRRASLSEALGYSSAPHAHTSGIVDFLVGGHNGSAVTEDSIIHHNVKDIEGLDLIPCGLIPPNPSELLAEDTTRELIESLKTRYDYVIFDCAPVELVADTLIINKFVDMTVFVVRAGMFHKDLLSVVQEMYDTQRYRSMAIVLNATLDRPGYGYHYGYGYGYGRRYYNRKPVITAKA